MKTFRMPAAIAAGLISISLVSGCAQSPTENEADEPLQLLTWSNGKPGGLWDTTAKSFEAATGIAVEIEVIPSENYVQVVSARIEAGTAPDLLQIGSPTLESFAEAGLLADLSDEPWVERGIPAVQDLQNYLDGSTYSFIPAMDVSGVYYDVDLFESLGLDVPETWDEFLEVVKDLREAGVIPISVAAKEGWPLVVQANEMVTGALYKSDESKALHDGTLKFSESGWADVLDDWEELIAAGAYDDRASGMDLTSSFASFAEGEAGMIIQGSYSLNSIRELNPEMNLGMFPLPYPGANEPVASVSYGSIMAIPANASNVEGAKEFFRFIAEEENLLPFLDIVKAFPGFTGVTANVDPSLEAIAPLVETNSAEFNLVPGADEEVVAAMTAGLQGLLNGSVTPKEVLERMDAAQR